MVRTMAGKGGSPPDETVRKMREEQVRRMTLRQYRSRNILVASMVLGTMAAVYIYTIRVTRQEHFLDDEFEKRKGQGSSTTTSKT